MPVLATGQRPVCADLARAWFSTTLNPSAPPRKKEGMAIIREGFGLNCGPHPLLQGFLCEE